CGKTTSARILARALNCENGPAADPCGECRSCRDLARGGPGSVDVIEIDAASHGGVDDARDLRERAFFAPVASRYKVYLIDEAHMVSTQGFNALLKLVEEPPPHLKFIFATTEPEKVIGTIRSRTHHYPFRLIPPRTLSAYLAELCDKEAVQIEPAALPLVVRAGAGSARDTLSVLDQLIGGAGDDGVTYELATGLLGYTPDTLLDEVVDAFAAGDGGTVFGVVDKVIETGQDPRRFTEDLLRRLRDLVIISQVPDAPATGLIDVPEDQGERLVAQAARFGRSELSRAADLVASGLTEMRGATAPRLLLELICARVLLPGADDSTEGLLARLDRIEKRISIEGGAPSTEQHVGRPAAAREAPPTRAAAPSAPAATPTPQDRSFMTAEPRDLAPTPAPQQPEQRPAEPVKAPETQPAGQVAQGEAPPEQPTPAQPPAESAPADAPPAAETPAPSGGLSLVDVRRLWPDLLESVKLKRRFTWIMLSQNAQVAAVDDRTLTIALLNAGARDSFLRSGSDEILRQAAIDVIGQDWRVETIVDPSAQPGAEPDAAPRITKSAVSDGPVPPTAPAAPAAAPPDSTPPPDWATGGPEASAAPEPAPEPSPEPARQPVDPAVIANARGSIQPTRATGPGGPKQPSVSDEDAHRDDPDADDHGLGGAALLERELGARVIEEIKHD
ncbi:MAG TPA: DNA polymerase III subunit gamma and tau, partial [Nocardioidaceae bacterium]|nr:DNA polymerase III subunit gamma and tau [Nocardioidaceae bacterium]